jgi:hypothetical protein
MPSVNVNRKPLDHLRWGGAAAVSVFDYILPKDFKICQKTQILPKNVTTTVPKKIKSW